MKAIIVKRARVRSIAVAILLGAIETVVAQRRAGLALDENALLLPRSSSKNGARSRTAKVHGVNTNLQRRKKTNSFGFTDSVNMQNGIWVWTIITRGTQSKDTSSPMAISKMSTAAHCSQLKPELANMATPKSKTLRQNWNGQ